MEINGVKITYSCELEELILSIPPLFHAIKQVMIEYFADQRLGLICIKYEMKKTLKIRTVSKKLEDLKHVAFKI